MKQTITKASKRWLSLLLAVIMTATMIPLSVISAFAFSTSSGQTVDSAYGTAYIGSDGKDYPVGANHYALRYNADGSTYIEPSQIGTRRTKLSIIKNGEVMQALCIEYGIDIDRGSATYVSANATNSAYFNMLPMTARRGIMLATIYGWQPGKALPIGGINEDDFSLATQEIIWEYQQGIRTSPTTRVNNGNIRADQFYDEIKGRPAELAYNWILSKMATHATVPSFTKSDRDNAPTHTLKYDASTKKYTVTLTDTNNTGVDITCTSGSGITVSRNGNKYTFTSSSMISSAVTLEYKKNISLYGDEFLVWGNVGHQTMVTGVSDPIRFYASFNTETNGTGRIVKSSEDGKVSGISFKITGNGVDKTVTTGTDGFVNVQLLPGTYTVTEQTPNKYEPQQSQTITIVSGQTTTVRFNNVLKRGDVKVTKTSEDGLVSGIKFRIYGTSESGASVDEYATTNNSGVATFNDILIGSYILEEVDTATKYVTPAKQSVTVKWNEVTNASFYNELKRGDVKVIKSAEDNFVEGHRFHLYGTSISGEKIDLYAVTNKNGVAEFKDVLIGTGYTLEEVDTAEQYIVPDSQNVTIEWDKVTEKNFENELKRGNVKVIKTSEDNYVSGHKFHLYGTSTSGAKVELYATTDKDGVAEFKSVLIGTYKLEEVNTAEQYITPVSQNVTVEWDKVTEKTFFNELKRGELSVTKNSEDGIVEGHKFRLYGTSISGATVELYAETNKSGIATFKDVLIGTYTLEEIDTAERYIVPAEQKVVIEWNKVTEKSFYNELKRGDVKVIKTSEDNFIEGHRFRLHGTSLSGEAIDLYAETNTNGIAEFNDVLIGSNYVLEEIDTVAWYIIPDVQNTVIKWKEVTEVSFKNILKRGDLTVTKTSEDGLIEGHKFHLFGTSLSGIPVDMYATTDENGVAHFEDVLIGVGYTLEEVDTAIRYVVTESQIADIEWNKITNKAFENILKKWRAEVYKYDSEFADRAQGDATLAGAVYGVYDGDELIDTYTTDENGHFITDYYVCGDDWTIREISHSEGYLIDAKMHNVGASAKLYTVELNTVNMDVTEDVIKGSISIIKHCDDGSTKIETPEVGAEFKVYLTSAGSYNKAHETERYHLVCDENGYAETKMLPYGTYTVEQIKGWNGREMMKPFTVTITEDGKVYRYIINNAVFESYIKIVKVDAETGNTIPYAGAGFKLYRPDGTPVTQTFTYPEVTVIDTLYTNDKGYLITPESLEYGTGYYLVEVTAPHGYVLNNDPVYFDVAADGAKDENGITIVEVTKPNMAQKGIIKLYKTGEVFASVTETDGLYQPVYSVKGLPGAEYEIRAAQDIVTPDGTVRYTAGEVIDTIITDENGYAESKALYLGKYEIIEIKAPYGMVLSDEVHTVELIYAGQEIEITETSAELWNDRQKITVMLDKLMEQDDIFGIGQNGEITSVVFGLYAAEELTAADGTVIPTDGLIEVMTVNENGTATCKSDLPFGSYYLKEIATDEHYILNDIKYSFTFEYAGQDIVVVELKANDGTPIENKLIYGEIHGIKKDDGGNAVSGALIGLFRVDATEFAEDTAILTTTSSEDGSFSFVGVPYGEWIVREIKAPAGYILTEESYPVTVNYHGEIIEVEIVNERISGAVQLTKVDADYPENKLTGAEFEVYRDTNGNKQLDESDELIGMMSEVEVGVYKLTDLLYGGYFVKETVAPEGFYFDSTAHYFEIIENGESVIVENEAGIGFINTAQVGKLKIIKTSFDGKVEGFTFRVTGPYGYDKTFVTDKNGEIVIENLRIGDGYIVSEVENEASSKYLLPKDKYAAIFEGAITTVEMYNDEKSKTPYNPQTGDNFWLWVTIAGISTIGFALTIHSLCKKKNKGKSKNIKG